MVGCTIASALFPELARQASPRSRTLEWRVRQQAGAWGKACTVRGGGMADVQWAWRGSGPQAKACAVWDRAPCSWKHAFLLLRDAVIWGHSSGLFPYYCLFRIVLLSVRGCLSWSPALQHSPRSPRKSALSTDAGSTKMGGWKGPRTGAEPQSGECHLWSVIYFSADS